MSEHHALNSTVSRQPLAIVRRPQRPSRLGHLNVTLSIASLTFFPLLGPLDFLLGPVARSWTGAPLSPDVVWGVFFLAPFVVPACLWCRGRLLPGRIATSRRRRYGAGHALVAAANAIVIGTVAVPYTLATLSAPGASANLAWYGVLAVPLGFVLDLAGLVCVYSSAGRGAAAHDTR